MKNKKQSNRETSTIRYEIRNDWAKRLGLFNILMGCLIILTQLYLMVGYFPSDPDWSLKILIIGIVVTMLGYFTPRKWEGEKK